LLVAEFLAQMTRQENACLIHIRQGSLYRYMRQQLVLVGN